MILCKHMNWEDVESLVYATDAGSERADFSHCVTLGEIQEAFSEALDFRHGESDHKGQFQSVEAINKMRCFVRNCPLPGA